MGAVTFSLDPRLVTSLQSELPLRVLIETGTFNGDTVEELKSYFDKVVSIELSETLWADAAKRFEAYPHVQILLGSSKDKLRELQSELKDAGALYWLDAHWCVATDTAGELSQCPLLEELQAIGKLNNASVVLIDDARLFQSPPLAPHEISQWPRFHQIVSCLLTLSSEHELMVVNDVIAFYPLSAKSVMTSYAQNCGIDWLVATNCLKENGTFIQQLVEKEAVIQQHVVAVAELQTYLNRTKADLVKAQADLAEAQAGIFERDSVISVLSKAVTAYRLMQMFSPTFIFKRLFGVRLGKLNQYGPYPLRDFPTYKSSTALTDLPTISIVTPSFRQGQFIEHTLLSVLNQKYPKLEYWVQDGGSMDNTIAIIKSYEERLSGWVSEKDSGQSQAINLGFANTKGEIMAWLNSDDLLLPGTLAIIADYFNEHPDVDVVYGDRLLINENGMEIGRWIMPGHDSDILSWVDYVPQETLFWRRSIWDKVGGHIDESFKFAMDWDLLVRFRDAGAKFAHIPRFLGAFRVHEHQKTSAAMNESGHQEINRIRKRVHGSVPPQQEIEKAALPFLRKHILADMLYRIKTRFGG